VAKKPKIIKVLGQEVDENVLKTSLRDVLKKRGLTAHLIIEDKEELKKRLEELRLKGADYSDYGNVYKYAFF